MASIHDVDQLFMQYLEVCNRAMREHGSRFPYNHIWKSAEEALSGDAAHLTVYDDLPQRHYAVRLLNKAVHLAPCSATIRKYSHLKTSYLQHVISHAEDYIAQPTLLNWEWLNASAAEGED